MSTESAQEIPQRVHPITNALIDEFEAKGSTSRNQHIQAMGGELRKILKDS